MKKHFPLIALLLLSFLFLHYFYSDVLYSPNCYLFSVHTDGLKNYYTVLYHVKHDASFHQFEGMNYPFGETVSFVDCQPILSNSIKAVSCLFPSIIQYTVGIMNLTMLLSLVFCAFLLFNIFQHYKTSYFYAVPAALSITALASHVLLWQVGHYALSYLWSMPLCWLMLEKYRGNTTNHRKYAILTGIAIFFMFRLHVYLGVSSLAYTVFYLFFTLWQSRIENKRAFVLDVFLSSAFPLLLQIFIMKITDSHIHTPPESFELAHRASFWNVFVPNQSICRSIFGLFLNLDNQARFSWSLIGNYIGLSSIFALIVAIGVFCKRISRSQHAKLAKFFPSALNAAFLSSVILLVYAFALPNYIADKTQISILSPLKQFISIGRFAWPFYFVVTVYSVIFVNRLISKSSIKALTLGAMIILFFVEAMGYHQKVSDSISRKENWFLPEKIPPYLYTVLETKGIDYTKYQAIIALPFYYLYFSEFQRQGTTASKNSSMLLSYHTHLPLMNAFLSRPSSQESLLISTILQSQSGNLKKYLKNDKPILILATNETLQKDEKQLLSKANLLYKNQRLALYEIAIEML